MCVYGPRAHCLVVMVSSFRTDFINKFAYSDARRCRQDECEIPAHRVQQHQRKPFEVKDMLLLLHLWLTQTFCTQCLERVAHIIISMARRSTLAVFAYPQKTMRICHMMAAPYECVILYVKRRHTVRDYVALWRREWNSIEETTSCGIWPLV